MEKQEFKALKILHIAFSAGTASILLINHLGVKNVAMDNLSAEMDTTSLSIIGLGTILAVLSIAQFKRMTNSSLDTPSDTQLRKAFIVKWAFLEAGAIISFLYFFFLNGHQLTLVSGLTLLFLLMISGPKEANFI